MPNTLFGGVTTTEAEQGKRLSEPLIKKITGNDQMTAQFLYGEYFNATNEYRGEMDVMGNFLKVCCRQEKGLTIRIRELYKAYSDWCDENNEHAVGAFFNIFNCSLSTYLNQNF